MELKIAALTIPEAPSFNYEELKQELIQKASVYETMVYGEDQIKAAKKDRASLNALKKALNDERIRREKEYMLPFNQFKAQIQEIIQIIDKPCMIIDQQIKAFEDQQKKERYFLLNEFWGSIDHPSDIGIDQIFDNKWLNASTKIDDAKAAITAKAAQIASDMKIINDLPEYKLEAQAMYFSTLDLGRSLSQANRLKELAEQQKARESERAAQKALEAAQEHFSSEAVNTPAEKATEAERKWIPFQAYLSAEEAKALGAFLMANNIKCKAI